MSEATQQHSDTPGDVPAHFDREQDRAHEQEEVKVHAPSAPHPAVHIPPHVLDTGKPVARIEHWLHVGDQLVGEVHDHPRQSEFSPTGPQVTSRIVRLSLGGHYAETENTIYVLGEPVPLA